MIGQIVKFKNTNNYYIIVKEINYEKENSKIYNRKCWFTPYDPKRDDIVIDIDSTLEKRIKDTRLPYTVAESKQEYQKYGYSKIRNREMVYFERRFGPPIASKTR